MLLRARTQIMSWRGAQSKRLMGAESWSGIYDPISHENGVGRLDYLSAITCRKLVKYVPAANLRGCFGWALTA